mgnify:CR=1 FL=1
MTESLLLGMITMAVGITTGWVSCNLAYKARKH